MCVFLPILDPFTPDFASSPPVLDIFPLFWIPYFESFPRLGSFPIFFILSPYFVSFPSSQSFSPILSVLPLNLVRFWVPPRPSTRSPPLSPLTSHPLSFRHVPSCPPEPHGLGDHHPKHGLSLLKWVLSPPKQWLLPPRQGLLPPMSL